MMRGRGKATLAKKNVTKAAIVVKKKVAPITTMRNMLDIESYFNECILDQPTSIRNLSSTLSAMIDDRKYSATKKNRHTFMIALAGPSGTGKTATINRLRSLLGMTEGYEYESLFIEYCVKSMDKKSGGECGDVDDHHDESHKNNGLDIIERINKALATTSALSLPPPPYVVLFVHNFGHATYAFKLVVNSLVCGNSSLVLPEGTTLLIVCTCHYGGDKIAMMNERDDDMAEQYIRDEMRRSIVDTTTQRIGLFLPYYLLNRDVLKLLLGQRLDKFVRESGIVERFGAQALETAPAMKEMLINHVLGKGECVGSLHNVGRVLDNKLTHLFQAGTTVYDGLQKKPLTDTIHLESSSFNTRLFGAILERELDKVTGDFIKSLKNDPRNQQILAKCDPNREGTVDSVSMRYGENPLCGLVMNVNYVTINNYYDTQETTKITEELKARNKKLKGCLIAVNAAVEKEPHGAIGGIIQNNKELFNESSEDSGEETGRSLICVTKRKASDEYENGLPKFKKARVEEVLPVVVATAATVEPKEELGETNEDFYPLDELIFSDEQEGSDIDFDILESGDEWEYVPPIPKKKGRPYGEIKGFTRICGPSGRPSWECKKCTHRVSKIPYARKHKCL